MLTDGTVRGLLAALAAPRAAPAGGSACALASAAGASLLMMVAGLRKKRSGVEADRTILAPALRDLTGIQRKLIDAIDADAAAYRQVIAAFELPKTGAAQLKARDAAVKRALRAASEVPLEIIGLSVEALKLTPMIAEHCRRPAASDVVSAIALLRAGLEGARSAVSSNLASLTDDEFVAAAEEEIVRLSADAANAAAQAERWLAPG
jgi:methenyltetrahydrofolate cyclohydrolase